MSRATPDDQLKFLLSCIKHSNNGKIDFVEVAKECGIVSKGAAAKRYERLLRANGLHPNGGPSDRSILTLAPQERLKTATAKATAQKKRKLDESAAGIRVNDNDHGMLNKLTLDPRQGDWKRLKPDSTVTKEISCLTMMPPLPPATAAASQPPFSVQFSPPPRPQPLFDLPQGARPPQIHYGHPMTRMAHYPGPLMPMLPPMLPTPMSAYQPPVQPSIIPTRVPALEDRAIFEDFCTPELFEQRSFLELPHERAAPTPLPPQEVTMKDLPVEGDAIQERQVEKQPEEPRSGKRIQESILIID